jgi:hypothetical protein
VSASSSSLYIRKAGRDTKTDQLRNDGVPPIQYSTVARHLTPLAQSPPALGPAVHANGASVGRGDERRESPGESTSFARCARSVVDSQTVPRAERAEPRETSGPRRDRRERLGRSSGNAARRASLPALANAFGGAQSRRDPRVFDRALLRRHTRPSKPYSIPGTIQ